MTYSDYARALLALLVWREARGEIYQAKLAVAYSVLNRVEHPKWWGHTLGDVIGKKWQYSSMAAPGDPNLIAYPSSLDVSFVECLKAVDSAIAGTNINPVLMADSYFDVSITAPVWATASCFIAQIGRLRFYNTDGDHPENITGSAAA